MRYRISVLCWPAVTDRESPTNLDRAIRYRQYHIVPQNDWEQEDGI
jgi:hypothetical protein